MATFYPPIDWIQHPLHAAGASGNRSEVERLIAEGFDVNEILFESVLDLGLAGTPLHTTILHCEESFRSRTGHHEVVEVLLAAGADVRLCREWDGTALHDAARFGLTGIAEMLIAHGADVNDRGDYLDRTPLHLAATYNQLGMIDFLISKGAELEPIAGEDDRDGARTSPYWRQYGGSLARILKRVPGTGTPLQMAATEGYVEAVQKLFELGARQGIDLAIEMAEKSRTRWQKRFDEVLAVLEDEQNRVR